MGSSGSPEGVGPQRPTPPYSNGSVKVEAPSTYYVTESLYFLPWRTYLQVTAL